MDSNSIIILAVAAALLVGFQLLARRGRSSPSQVAAKLRAGAKAIDVRSPSEFASGSYPGAKNLPLDRLQAKPSSLGPKDGAYVLFCASGARSSQAARILKEAGYTDVSNAGPLSALPR